MAVCGRCWLCGSKFSGAEADEAVRWSCGPCEREHAICVNCHAVMEGGALNQAVVDLVGLLAMRTPGETHERVEPVAVSDRALAQRVAEAFDCWETHRGVCHSCDHYNQELRCDEGERLWREQYAALVALRDALKAPSETPSRRTP
jgi:hypothetical protein